MTEKFNALVQVGARHYHFDQYMTSGRWMSLWYQLRELNKLKPNNILEIGPGRGYLKALASIEGLSVETLDIDPELRPDYVGSVENLPFSDAEFDVCCAFQVLEHLPYDMFEIAVKELIRVSSRYVLISLPNSELVWRYRIYIPRVGEKTFMIPRPFGKFIEHKFDGQHYWEVNKLGYEMGRIFNDLSKYSKSVRHWRPWENPYHSFFLLEKSV